MQSKTYKKIGNSFSIQYGDKSVVLGVLSSDVLRIGDLTIPDQIFAEITYESCLLLNFMMSFLFLL